MATAGISRFVRYVALSLLFLAAGIGAKAPEQASVALPGERAFPESMTSTADGTIYVGNLADGGIVRVKNGRAESWIKPGALGSRSIYGVYADERSGILWACSNDLVKYGGTSEGDPGSSVKGFDLKTGEGKISAAFPAGRAECNDFAVGSDGSVYVSDTAAPRILKLSKGGTTLSVWATDARFAQKGGDTDGIAFGGDGQLYVNTLGGSHLFRVALDGDASGTITEITTSRPIEGADGMRHMSGNEFFMIEVGRLSRVVVNGDSATVTTLREGLAEPTGVAIVGHTAWVAEGRLSYIFDKSKKGSQPTLPFQLRAVALTK